MCFSSELPINISAKARSFLILNHKVSQLGKSIETVERSLRNYGPQTKPNPVSICKENVFNIQSPWLVYTLFMSELSSYHTELMTTKIFMEKKAVNT